jgi:hypothetical protein
MRGPTAGPIASRRAGNRARDTGACQRLRAANESPSRALSRVGATRVAAIQVAMDERDWEVLSFVSAARLASGLQLVRGVYGTDRQSAPGPARVARKRIKRLGDLRVIEAIRPRTTGGLHGGSDTLIYAVGPVGARLLARRGLQQRRLSAPGARYVDHTLACTQVAVELRASHQDGGLELIEAQLEPECWRAYLDTYGRPVTLKPDLFVRVAIPGSAHEYRVMVEVDRDTEAAGTIRRKARGHLAYLHAGVEFRDHGVHPRVIWSAPDARRAAQLESMLAAVPEAERLFAVCCQPDLIATLIAEARR